MACAVVWFRRDLRVEDNSALVAAVRAGVVAPVFIWTPEEEGQFLPGRVSRWWLKQSLIQLQQSLASLGSPLILRRARSAITVLLQIIKETGASQIFFNHLYDPVSLVRDHKVKQELLQAGVSVNTFNADLLYEPWEVNDEHGHPFTTFAGFWSKCMSMTCEPDAPLLPPKRINKWPGTLCSLSVEDLQLEDESEKGSNDLLARAWAPGWAYADRALEAFVRGPLLDYGSNRQKVDSCTTSLLSPHLHYGELSVRKIFHCVRMKQVLCVKEGNAKGVESVDLYLRSIGYREYSRYLSFNFPFAHERSLLSNLKFFPWRNDEGYFKVWRQGRTGYPLVDAGMRELWATGWLHNRIRVIVSSFFVKFLHLPWRWGMKYFWDTLLDADLESDVLGWQYISGSLPDGHDLHRIDNPQVEGYRFDPCGEYVRRWLPELSRLPSEWIHHPWDAPPSVLRAAGIELGSNYPRPIVEVAAARERLEQALATMYEAATAGERAAVRVGFEEGLGDTGGLQGQDASQDMDIDRGATHGMRERSPHDQMVPSMPVEVSRPPTGTGSYQGSERARAGAGFQLDNGNVMWLQGGNEDASSTAESTSAHREAPGVGLPAWSRFRSPHTAMHQHQDDSQVPLVPELRHGVLSR